MSNEKKNDLQQLFINGVKYSSESFEVESFEVLVPNPNLIIFLKEETGGRNLLNSVFELVSFLNCGAPTEFIIPHENIFVECRECKTKIKLSDTRGSWIEGVSKQLCKTCALDVICRLKRVNEEKIFPINEDLSVLLSILRLIEKTDLGVSIKGGTLGDILAQVERKINDYKCELGKLEERVEYLNKVIKEW